MAQQVASATPLEIETENDPSPEPQLQPVAQFGVSEAYGERLDYSKKKCRNPICFVLYYMHVFALIGLTIWLCAYAIPQHEDSKNKNNLINENNHHFNSANINDFNLAVESKSTVVPLEEEIAFEFTGLCVAVFTSSGVAIIIGFIWMQVLRAFAGPVMKAMLILNILVWVALFIVGCIYVNPWLIGFGAFFMIVFSFWSWCVWDRVKFSVVLMDIAARIVTSYHGTVWLSVAIIIFDLVWIFTWSVCIYAYFYYITEANIKFNFWIFLFLLIALFWGLTVNKNILHTTTCGVTATWYFTSRVHMMPTLPAFCRSMTTSFGSIALGSFFVSILEAIRSMFKHCDNSSYCCIRCCVSCILSCINWSMIYFNKYAYAHCAIYGSGFIPSAKATWNLFMNRGMAAVINDDLTGSATFVGALVSGVICGGISWGIGMAFYNDVNVDDWEKYGLITCIAIFGGIIGIIMCLIIMMPLPSAVQCVFVCWAEEPEILHENRPKEYAKLSAVTSQMGPPRGAQAAYPGGKAAIADHE